MGSSGVLNPKVTVFMSFFWAWSRWAREEKVNVPTHGEPGYAIQLSNETPLDVHPSTEYKMAWVKGSTCIPIFDVDNKLDAGTLSRHITTFVMGIKQDLMTYQRRSSTF
ncbi:hypothetical protein RGQ29_004282 [Quercus rubra]|uniref:Uncharacterized protein n=1 Tax=Quercus rubra TaxID=3512 RepID=A0AAN7EDU9_QUERU|nr:hypothetical protein RGQ29_004282 [Quercus rubra]